MSTWTRLRALLSQSMDAYAGAASFMDHADSIGPPKNRPREPVRVGAISVPLQASCGGLDNTLARASVGSHCRPARSAHNREPEDRCLPGSACCDWSRSSAVWATCGGPGPAMTLFFVYLVEPLCRQAQRTWARVLPLSAAAIGSLPPHRQALCSGQAGWTRPGLGLYKYLPMISS